MSYIVPTPLSGSGVFTPLTGTTITIPNTYYHYNAVITPASSLAELTIALPSSSPDGTYVTIVFNQPITSLIWAGGAAITGMPASASAGAQVNLYWSTTAAEWYGQYSVPAPPALVTITPGFCKNIRSKIAQVLAGTSNARILLLGDSNTAGFGAAMAPPQTESYVGGFPLNYPNAVASAMLPIWSPKNQYCGAQNLAGGASTIANYKLYDQRLTYSGSATVINSFGNLSGDCLGFTSNAVGSFTFAMADQFDSFEVGFVSNTNNYVGTATAGSTSVTLNGNQAIAIRTATGSVSPKATSITISVPATGGGLPILWIRTWDSTRPSIQLMQAGWAGGNIANSITTTNPYSSGNQIGAMGFDLVICHGMLLNDTSTAPATWATSFTTLKDLIRNSGADMAYTTSMNTQPDATNWAAYKALNQQGRTSSMSFNIPMLEIEYEWFPSSRYLPPGTTQAGSYFGWTGTTYDGRHPSGIGYSDIANKVSRLIESLAGV